MARLAISIEDETLDKVERRAQEEGTSVDLLLKDFLETYAGEDRLVAQQGALRALIEISNRSRTGSGGRKWSREELYEL